MQPLSIELNCGPIMRNRRGSSKGGRRLPLSPLDLRRGSHCCSRLYRFRLISLHSLHPSSENMDFQGCIRYCPSCKVHQQASKKLDLWRLPDVLVVHLKRFSYSRFAKNKLETLVDFPIHDFDLSSYVACGNGQNPNLYSLYAVSNHYGSMGGGHYTAFVRVSCFSIQLYFWRASKHAGDGRWYDFDDRHVLPISEESVKTSAAYVLFYKKVQTTVPETDQ